MNSIDKRITSSSAGDIKSLRAASTGTGTSGATTVTNGNAIRQTAQITENILSNLATTAPKPPCYYNCGCGCNNLY